MTFFDARDQKMAFFSILGNHPMSLDIYVYVIMHMCVLIFIYICSTNRPHGTSWAY